MYLSQVFFCFLFLNDEYRRSPPAGAHSCFLSVSSLDKGKTVESGSLMLAWCVTTFKRPLSCDCFVTCSDPERLRFTSWKYRMRHKNTSLSNVSQQRLMRRFNTRKSKWKFTWVHSISFCISGDGKGKKNLELLNTVIAQIKYCCHCTPVKPLYTKVFWATVGWRGLQKSWCAHF